MHLNKDLNNQAKHLLSENIFGKIESRQLFRMVALVYVALISLYEQTILKRLFTDAVMETIGKVGAQWTNKSYTAFYYLNSPDQGRYDHVKLCIVPFGTTTTDLNEGKVQLKTVNFKLYSLCYYPVAFGLALAFAMPLKFSKKIFLLALSMVGLTALIMAKFMIFLMHRVPIVNGEMSNVELVYQMLNAHAGMSTILIFLFVLGTAVWIGRSVET